MADIKIIQGDKIYADVQTVDCFATKDDIESQKVQKKLSLGEMEELGGIIGIDKKAEQETDIAFSNHADNAKLIRDNIGLFTGEIYTNVAKKDYLQITCNFNIVLHNSGFAGISFSGDGTKYAVTKNFWISIDHVTNVPPITTAEQEAIDEAERKRLLTLALTPKAPSAPAPDSTKTIFGLVVFATLLGGGYYLYNNNKKKKALVAQATLGIVSDNITTERKNLN